MMRAALVCGVVVAMLGVPATAHHSFGAVYLEGDSIEVNGIVVEFQYKNPHSWVHVRGSERNNASGEERVYSAEWVSTSQLESQGIEKTTLKVGDKVTVWGSPSKNPSDYRMHLKRIERSDGWQWRGRQQAR
jgi:hypothetical protein